MAAIRVTYQAGVEKIASIDRGWLLPGVAVKVVISVGGENSLD